MPIDLSNVSGKKKPCQTPGCNYPNWHVCLVGKPDLFPKLLAEESGEEYVEGKPKKRRGVAKDEAWRASISLAQQERWERVRQENAFRDRRIAERYAEGDISIRDLAKHFNVGTTVVRNVLRAAQNEGRLRMRVRGQTIKHQK